MTKQQQSQIEILLKRFKLLLEIACIIVIFFSTFFCVEWHSQMPEIIFFVLLIIITLFLALFLFNPFQSDAILYFWIVWVFWIVYSFGYYSESFFLQSLLLVFIYTIFSNLFYMSALILSLDKERATGKQLIILFILSCFMNIVPLENNNIFMEHSFPFIRTAFVCLLVILLNFQYRHKSNNNYQTQRLSKDLTLRFLIQINYMMFGYSYLAFFIFTIHIVVLLLKSEQILLPIVENGTLAKYLPQSLGQRITQYILKNRDSSPEISVIKESEA